MRRKNWQRLAIGMSAAFVIGLSVPSVVGAQSASPGAQSPGVTGPVQLPRTGNPEPETATPWLALVMGGGAVVAAAAVGARVQRGARRRR
jgi:hypothetical protein